MTSFGAFNAIGMPAEQLEALRHTSKSCVMNKELTELCSNNA